MRRAARLKKIKISIPELRLLWEATCQHQEKYGKPTNPLSWSWADCDDCVLARMAYQPKLGATKNICFLIWHEKILEPKSKRR